MEFTQEVYDKYRHMIYKLAWKYTRDESTFQDLVQEGTIGLRKACDRFKPKKGFKFSTFAYHKIHGQIRSYIAYKNSLIHIPVEKKQSVTIKYAELQEVEDETDFFLGWDLDNALAQLDKDVENLIRMHFFEGFTKTEISDKTGITYYSVVYQIDKGLKQMREYL